MPLSAFSSDFYCEDFLRLKSTSGNECLWMSISQTKVETSTLIRGLVQKEEMPTSTRRACHYCGLEGLPDVPKLCLTERDKTNPNVTERNA